MLPARPNRSDVKPAPVVVFKGMFQIRKIILENIIFNLRSLLKSFVFLKIIETCCSGDPDQSDFAFRTQNNGGVSGYNNTVTR